MIDKPEFVQRRADSYIVRAEAIRFMQSLEEDLFGFGMIFLIDIGIGALQDQVSPCFVGAIVLKGRRKAGEKQAQPCGGKQRAIH